MTTETKLWASSSHLSYLLGLPVVLPLILLVWKRNSDPFVAAQAKQAIGLHVVTLLVGAVMGLFIFGTFGLGMLVALPMLAVFGLLAVIFSIVAVFKISEGQSYHYPVFGDWVARL